MRRAPRRQVLINKKYALHYRVIDALVAHFLSFVEAKGPMPVIWHQALLAFAQRYKTEISHEQKTRLKALLKAHVHHAITPEVRRELFSTNARDEAPASTWRNRDASASSALVGGEW